MVITITDTVPLEQEEMYDRAYALLPEYRRQKVDRMHFLEDKKTSIAAGLLLNATVKRYQSGTHHKDLQYIHLAELINTYDTTLNYQVAEEELGKPYFIDYPEICFSIAHSGQYAVCVVNDSEAGIDIEQERPYKMEMAKRFFSKQECNWIQAGNKKERFFQIWTIREAYAKATGLGIARTLSDSSVVVVDKEAVPVQFENKLAAKHYNINNYRFKDAFVAVVLGHQHH